MMARAVGLLEWFRLLVTAAKIMLRPSFHTGFEMADALTHRGLEVTLIEESTQPSGSSARFARVLSRATVRVAFRLGPHYEHGSPQSSAGVS